MLGTFFHSLKLQLVKLFSLIWGTVQTPGSASRMMGKKKKKENRHYARRAEQFNFCFICLRANSSWIIN